MKQKKLKRIINEAIGFIHLMSDDTVSKKDGKKVIKRLQKIKFCNLHFVTDRRELLIAYDEWAYDRGMHKDGRITHEISVDMYLSNL